MKHTRYHADTNDQYVREGGFTLLLAALVASIALSLGGSIFLIAKKQIILSSIGKDSQFAFYAADSAAECALYYDHRSDYFSTTSPPTQIVCDAQTIDLDPYPPETDGDTGPWTYTIFRYQYNPGGRCARVAVTKELEDIFDTSTGEWRTVVSTTITADGHSVPCASVGTDPRALQRTVELDF